MHLPQSDAPDARHARPRAVLVHVIVVIVVDVVPVAASGRDRHPAADVLVHGAVATGLLVVTQAR